MLKMDKALLFLTAPAAESGPPQTPAEVTPTDPAETTPDVPAETTPDTPTEPGEPSEDGSGDTADQAGTENMPPIGETDVEGNGAEADTTEAVVQEEPLTFPQLFTTTGHLWGLWIALAAAIIGAAVTVGILTLLRMRCRRKRRKGEGFPATRIGAGDEPIQIGKIHDQGARQYQQDCFSVSPVEAYDSHGLLAVVADGMGGLQNGDVVSQTVVSTMMNAFLQSPDTPPEPLMWQLLRQANGAVNQLLRTEGMGSSGSTLVAGIVREGKFQWISVGDSRICLWRDGKLVILNREHDYLHELQIRAANGRCDLQDAYSDPQSGGLTSYLGQGDLAHVDTPVQAMDVYPGDVLILMSDGVYNALSKEEFIACLTGSAQDMAQNLGNAIAEKNHARQDNYTAVILQLEEPAKGGAAN